MFYGTPLRIMAGVVFTLLLLFAAVGDVRSRRIPNRVVLALGILGLLYSAFAPISLSGALRGLGGAAIGFGLWLPFYVLGWLGAGDVKLFAAAGAWLGPVRTIEGSAIAALLGALLAFLWMLRFRGMRNAVETLGIAATTPSVLTEAPVSQNNARAIPYGVVIAIGAISAGWLPGLLLR